MTAMDPEITATRSGSLSLSVGDEIGLLDKAIQRDCGEGPRRPREPSSPTLLNVAGIDPTTRGEGATR
jgi:hypothetical protein